MIGKLEFDMNKNVTQAAFQKQCTAKCFTWIPIVYILFIEQSFEMESIPLQIFITALSES